MRLHRRLMVFAMLGLSTAAIAQSGSQRLGVVNGETITEEQVTRTAAAELENLELKRLQNLATYTQDKHDIIKKALNALMEDKLLDAEAAKRKISKDDLIQQEVVANVKDPTAAEMDLFYEANKARIPVSRAEALPQIRSYLMNQRAGDAQEAFIDRLKKAYGAASFLEPHRTDISTAGFPSFGPDTAPITIVEFSDFECQFCGGLFPTVKEVEKNYGDKVRIVFRQFPLNSIHPRAQKAAEASLCANDQKQFWKFHDSLFGNQKELSTADLKQRAADMKLDTAAFNSCLDSGRQADAVKKDIVEGSRVGVTGTPALFINGRMLVGNQPYAAIAGMIDDELQRKKVNK